MSLGAGEAYAVEFLLRVTVCYVRPSATDFLLEESRRPSMTSSKKSPSAAPTYGLTLTWAGQVTQHGRAELSHV